MRGREAPSLWRLTTETCGAASRSWRWACGGRWVLGLMVLLPRRWRAGLSVRLFGLICGGGVALDVLYVVSPCEEEAGLTWPLALADGFQCVPSLIRVVLQYQGEQPVSESTPVQRIHQSWRKLSVGAVESMPVLFGREPFHTGPRKLAKECVDEFCLRAVRVIDGRLRWRGRSALAGRRLPG